jgi:hypothetical protein
VLADDLKRRWSCRLTAFLKPAPPMFGLRLSELPREAGGAATAKANREAMEKLGVGSVYYESAETAHGWQTWRRSLYRFAPLLFVD